MTKKKLNRYSSLCVSNTKSKTGYFFGCFYLITTKTYESIGTHKEVKNEIVEDAALGKKIQLSISLFLSPIYALFSPLACHAQ